MLTYQGFAPRNHAVQHKILYICTVFFMVFRFKVSNEDWSSVMDDHFFEEIEPDIILVNDNQAYYSLMTFGNKYKRCGRYREKAYPFSQISFG